MKIKHTDELRRKLKAAGPLAVKALASAALEEQEKVMALSQDRVPVKYKVLKGSGIVLSPKVRRTRVTVVAGYGGAASAYALKVHEMLGENVQWTTPGTGPKYLESAFDERAPHMPRRMARSIEQHLERLGQ